MPGSFLSTFYVCYSFNLDDKAGTIRNPILYLKEANMF